MKNKKMIMILAITLMAIGFASVSTVLYLNGQTFVASNTGDFDVYYSKAVENGTENATIIKDKTHIVFTTELTGIDDKYVLDYEVTNGSKQYDANLVMNCTGGNEYLRVENKFNTTEILPARTTRSGRLTLTVIKVPLTEMSVTISCEISGNAVERDAAGGDAIEIEKDYLALTYEASNSELRKQFAIEKFGSMEKFDEWQHEVCKEGYDSETCQNAHNEFDKEFEEWKKTKVNGPYLWNNIQRTMTPPPPVSATNDIKPFIQFLENETLPSIVSIKYEDVEKIQLTDTNKVPENAILSWDASNNQNGSIMAWVLDEDTNGLYEIHIGQNGGVKLNPNSSFLFASFVALKEIKGIESLDTSDVTNMSSMFSVCSSLTSISISNWNTNNVTDMNSMFLGCRSLTSISISNWNTNNVTNMNSMFYGCSNLTSLDVSHFDTKNVTDISSMFSGCSNLTSLDISHFDTKNVTDMGEMFCWCKKVKVLDVSNWNTGKVMNMSFVFKDCIGLTSLDVSGFDTSNVTSMAGMFSGCSNLTSLDVSHFNTSKVTSMEDMFRAYITTSIHDLHSEDYEEDYYEANGFKMIPSKLKEIKGIENFNTENVTSMKEMFLGCSNLHVNLENWNLINVTDITWMFGGCSKMNTSITLRGSKCTSYYYVFKYVIDSETGSTLYSVSADNAQITINYTEDASEIVDKIIAKKPSNSNVVKGTKI